MILDEKLFTVEMISLEEGYPEPFKDVLVYGLCEKFDSINFRFYIARRWSGLWPNPPKEKWEWLTQCDYLVKVSHWIPMPKFPEQT